MLLHITLWIIAIALIVVGLVGTVVPVIPGLVMIFAGSWLAAWIDNYQNISITALIIIAVLAIIGILMDWVGQSLGAKRAGASKLGIIGCFIGTICGILVGIWGIIFMPLLGAAIGEFIDRQDMIKSGKVGLATWVGMIVTVVVKLAIAFTMVGILIVDWFI